MIAALGACSVAIDNRRAAEQFALSANIIRTPDLAKQWQLFQLQLANALETDFNGETFCDYLRKVSGSEEAFSAQFGVFLFTQEAAKNFMAVLHAG